MIIPGFRCSGCQEEDILAIWPGREGEQGELFTLTPGRPVHRWCNSRWWRLFGVRELKSSQPKLPRRGSKAKAAALTQD